MTSVSLIFSVRKAHESKVDLLWKVHRGCKNTLGLGIYLT
jgi:hypothetical protein